jgi:hypothetical protein
VESSEVSREALSVELTAVLSVASPEASRAESSEAAWGLLAVVLSVVGERARVASKVAWPAVLVSESVLVLWVALATAGAEAPAWALVSEPVLWVAWATLGAEAPALVSASVLAWESAGWGWSEGLRHRRPPRCCWA